MCGRFINPLSIDGLCILRLMDQLWVKHVYRNLFTLCNKQDDDDLLPEDAVPET